jgi:hypothetical protein
MAADELEALRDARQRYGAARGIPEQHAAVAALVRVVDDLLDVAAATARAVLASGDTPQPKVDAVESRRRPCVQCGEPAVGTTTPPLCVRHRAEWDAWCEAEGDPHVVAALLAGRGPADQPAEEGQGR